MPRTFVQGLSFVLGFAIALWLSPFTIRIARADGPAPYAEREASFHAEVNAYRTSRHLIALERDPALDAVARGHSEDMARRGYFSHVNPDGQNPLDRIEASGRDDFTLAAENVGLTTRSEPNQQILQGWLASADHRRNLNTPPFNRTGIGIARSADGAWYYTQLYLTVPR
jgi:uncharacterized protein YkwD